MTTHDPLLDALDAPSAEAWRPEKAGDLIVGKIIGQGSYDAGYGEYDIWTIRVEQATQGGRPVEARELALHCLGTVLLKRTQEKGFRVGGRCAVRFDGTKQIERQEGKSKKLVDMKIWSVAFEPPKPGDDLAAKLDDDELPF